MRENKVLLPINCNPYLKSYTHNAFISAILSSQSVGGENVVKYKMLNETNAWENINNRCETKLEDGVTVSLPMRYENGYSLMYRECATYDQLIVEVFFRRKACAWEQFCLVLNEEIQEELFDQEKCVVKFGCPSGAKINVKRKERFVAIQEDKYIFADKFFLKIERSGLDISCFYSYKGKEWRCIYSDTLPAKYKIVPLYIGVLVEAKNQYMNWLTGNYIQMYMKKPACGEIMIDYYTGPTKHYKTYVSSHYLDFMFEYFNYDVLSCNKIKKIIWKRLLNNCYIVVDLNHYYISKTTYYLAKNYYHEVMIYGMNKKRGIYYVMGYGQQNIIFTYELKFCELWKALNPEGVRLITGKVDVNNNGYTINTEMIKKRLKDYLLGYNNEEDFADVLPRQETLAYGLDVFRRLIENDEELFGFCTDTRLSYFIYEHKKLMLERAKYLFTNVIDEENNHERVKELLEENVKIMQIVKNSILMNSIGGNKKANMKKIRGYLEQVMRNEEQAYSWLCELL